MMNTIWRVIATATFTAILLMQPESVVLEAQSEPPPPSLDQLITVCSPEKLFPRVGDTIEIHTYLVEQKNNKFSYTWTATGGKISGQGSTAKWDFVGVKPGTYVATAQIKDTQGNTLNCKTEVMVIAPQDLKGGNNITGRDFLIRGKQEDEGYGLYSYFLLGSRPDNASRERFLSAIKEYLRLSVVTELLKVVRDKKEINVTYLPLKISPDKNLLKKLEKQEERNYGEFAAWILDNYDYERAQELLKKIEGNCISGPYIVSFVTPLTSNTAEPPYLYQDQSLVPPDLISAWVKEYIVQAAQEKYWEERTIQMLALKMRIYVGYIGKGVPEVMEALDKVIALKGKLKIS